MFRLVALAAGFRLGHRSGGGAFAIGLALDDELVGAVAEAIQSALAQQRFIKDRHPFLHAAVRGEDRRAAGVAFDQQIVEVGSRLAGEFLQPEIVHHQEIGSDEASQFPVEGVVGTGAGQGFSTAGRLG